MLTKTGGCGQEEEQVKNKSSGSAFASYLLSLLLSTRTSASAFASYLLSLLLSTRTSASAFASYLSVVLNFRGRGINQEKACGEEGGEEACGEEEA
jgi:hypothetical protein